MRALILAAGRGSRLKDITAEKPKALTPLAGKPLLQWQLDALHGAGIKEVAIVRGYKAETLSFAEATFFENKNWAATNMVSSLLCADEWLTKKDCIVSYSDIVYPYSTAEQLAHSKGDIVISYNTQWLEVWQARFEDPLGDAETFRIDDKGMLLEIGKKANHLSEIQGQYMGLLKFTTHGWKMISDFLKRQPEEKVAKTDMTSLLQQLLTAGIPIATVAVAGKWYEVDNENDLQVYTSMIRENKSWMNAYLQP